MIFTAIGEPIRTVDVASKRVNLGSGKFPLGGWTNVDAYCEADVQEDFFACEFENLAEVRMCHVLEHVSWRQTVPLLERIRGWMRADGTIEIEVPDMEAILALGTQHPLWFKYIYGDQSHAGEYHLAGFTTSILAKALRYAGWRSVRVSQFCSTHPGRDGMPVLLARAEA